MVLIILLLIGFGIAARRFHVNISRELPDLSVDTLQELAIFSQSSMITDRAGKELYKLFEENREYVSYDDISPIMIDAIVAVEDEDFWTNNWLDYLGITRAAIDNVMQKLWRRDSAGGASTITQQLVRNLLLTRDRTIIRKLKEIVLTMRLSDVLESDITKRYSNISKTELQQKEKERIMELYLNYIFLGNNAYGIEAASQTYFNKPAKQLRIIETAILASIPKWPSKYEPYKPENKKRLMGYVDISYRGDAEPLSGNIKNMITQTISDTVNSLTLSSQSDNQLFMNIIDGKYEQTTTIDGKIYEYVYRPGRKDHVLMRMYQESYIDEQELKTAFIQWLDILFESPSVEIKAPHFVFRVKDILESDPIFEELGITQSTLLNGWLTIQTSLDYEMQEIAEEAVSNYDDDLEAKWWSNRAMIFLDSEQGDVLAYIGSRDYDNDEIEGKNDMIRAARQPWSTMKPLIYTYGFMTLPITIDTPIFDISYKPGPQSLNNADGKWLWLMPLRQALAYSRNIPAVKMYFAAGAEEEIKPYLQSLWMGSLSDSIGYGYPLALGGWEIPMLELANAYSHLSRLGEPAEIYPILQITGPDGEIIYKKEPKQQEQIIPAWAAYLTRDILSTYENMPPARVWLFAVRWLNLAIKSGTSDKKTERGARPDNGWLATYSPNRVGIFWAGNADGTAMNANAYGGWLNASIMKEFYAALLDKWLISNSDHSPVDIGKVSINKVSGKLTTEETPAEFTIDTRWYNATLPSEVDAGMSAIEYDTLCGWAISEFTPPTEVAEWYVRWSVNSFLTSQADVEKIKERLAEWNVYSGESSWDTTDNSEILYNLRHVFTAIPEEFCQERIPKEDLNIDVLFENLDDGDSISEVFEITYTINAPQNIQQITVLFDGGTVAAYGYDSSSFTDTKRISLVPWAFDEWVHTLTIIASDAEGFANTQTITVELSRSSDTIWPALNEEKVSIYEYGAWVGYEVTLFFTDASQVQGGKIKISNDEPEIEFRGNNVTFTIDSLQTIGRGAIDSEDNRTRGILNLTTYDIQTRDNQATEWDNTTPSIQSGDEETLDEIIDLIGGSELE